MVTLSFTTVAAAAIRRQAAKKAAASVRQTLRRGLASLMIVLVAAGAAHAGGGKSFSRSGGNFSKGGGNKSMQFNVQKSQNVQSLSLKSLKGSGNGNINSSVKKFDLKFPTNVNGGNKKLQTPRNNTIVNQKIGNSILKKNIVATNKSVGTKLKFDQKFGDVVKNLKPVVNHQGGIKNKIFIDKKFGQGKHIDKCFPKKHCDWNWCWKSHCNYSCYKPCKTWHCWDYPTWCGLYRHSCGYWYDVPAVVIRQGVDLQLLAIRFVDSGNPAENLGPRFRVWIRNNSPIVVDKPFNVLLMAGQSAAPSANLPQNGVRVESIAPGQVLPVDVRLPMEANQPSLAMIHVLIDSHREIIEVHENNNGTVVSRAEIPLVDAALLAIESPVAPVGAEVNVAGEGIGMQPGRAIVKLGGLDMEAEVIGWSEMGLRVRLPALPLASPTDAQLIVVRADGVATPPLAMQVVPAQAAMAEPIAPAGPAAAMGGPTIQPVAASQSVPLMLQGVVGQDGQPMAGQVGQ